MHTFSRNETDQRGTVQQDVPYSGYFLLVILVSEKFAKKLLGESEIEDVLQRLDRLTLDEAKMTATQTLQVVHGLVTNVKLVMDGM